MSDDLQLKVRGELLMVFGPDPNRFAIYIKQADRSQLVLKSCDAGEHYEFLIQAWQMANDKARELGWIV